MYCWCSGIRFTPYTTGVRWSSASCFVVKIKGSFVVVVVVVSHYNQEAVVVFMRIVAQSFLVVFLRICSNISERASLQILHSNHPVLTASMS